MQRAIVNLILTVFIGIAPMSAFAGIAEDRFSDGLQAFKNGEYRNAANAFEDAKAAGMESAALYYNLGVSYYRLGNYSRSKKAFLKTAGYESMEPLASYNLGLVSLKQSDKAAARDWFEKTLAGSEDEKLSELARYQLSILPADTRPPPAAWFSFATAGLGYDDNVTLDNDTLTAVSSQSDTYLEFLAATRGALSGTRKDGIVFKASLFADIYNDLTDFNLVEGNLGLYRTYTASGWSNEAGGYLTRSTLGGSDYLQSANLDFDTRKYLTEDFRLRFRARYRQIKAIDARFGYLDGLQARVRLEGRFDTSTKGKLRAYYELEHNDRNDFSTATTFSSLSPQRHTARFDYSRHFGADWYFRLGAEFRSSRYPDANIEANGDVIERQDDRWRYRFTLDRRLWSNTSIAIDYAHTDNDSNIDRYDYERNTVLGYLLFLF